MAIAIPQQAVRRRLDGERVMRGVLLTLFALFLWVFLAWPMAQIAWRSLLDNNGRFIGLVSDYDP